MTIPATIRAGDTVTWVEPATLDLAGSAATSAAWAFTSFLRFDATHEGATVIGVARADGGWNMTISAATSAGFDAGTWSWQSRITSGATVITVGSGSLKVLASLSYTGQPAAFDGRSQAEQDLDAVQSAIRALISGGSVRRYMIGGRQLEKYGLEELMKREAQLKAIVAREKAAEKIAAGLGDPRNLFVRFS